MDIKALQWELAAFVVDRGLDPLHTPKNLAMALASESGALLSLFKWANDDDGQGARPEQRDAAADAIADAILHAVHLADRLGIDLDEAIRRKLARNAEKYPIAVEKRQPAPMAERRAEPAKKSSPPRPRASVEPEPRSRPAPRSPPPAREVPRAARPTSQLPSAEQAQPPDAPPPARAARTAAPPQPPAPDPESPGEEAAPPQPSAPDPESPGEEAAPPQPSAPDPESPGQEAADPYADLDPDAARRLVEALSKQLNRARSDDPLARELHDELTTLKRTLYAENPKRAWLAGSLKSIHRILEEATSHSVGAELRAAEHVAAVERILKL